jgi:hypothetical protein
MKSHYPDIASSLQALSEQTTTSTPSLLSQSGTDDFNAPQYHALADYRHQLINQIRTLPQFEQFLSPKPPAELTRVVGKLGGPVVMLNSSDDRCDALILMPKLLDDVLRVPLPDVPLDKALALHRVLQHLFNYRDSSPTFKVDDLGDHSSDTDFGRLVATIVSHSHEPSSWNDKTLDQCFLSVLSLLWKWVVEPIVEKLALTVSVVRC